MEIPTYKPEDLETFHKLFRAYRSHDGFGNWFRGQSNVNWPLLPKAGRKEFYLPESRDLGRFHDWCIHAVAYCTLPKSKIESLAVAQHHGLATRLLDWTMNPLVAAYFCCIENKETDGSIFVLETPEQLANDDLNFELLKEHNGTIGYIPKFISPRMLNQRALFTIHCDAKSEIPITESVLKNGKPNLTRIVIEAKLKRELIKMLDDYGINQVVLFPDLDGLSHHMNHKTELIKK
jgi:hypothetical protein